MIPGNQRPTQNLIEGAALLRKAAPPVSPEESRTYKLLFLEVLTVGSALLYGYTVKRFLDGDGALATALIIAAAFGTCSVLAVTLTKNLTRRYVGILLETAAVLMPFYTVPVGLLLFTGIVLFIFLAWGETAAFREIENSVKIRLGGIAKTAVSKFTTAAILTLIFFYLGRVGAGTPVVSQTVFGKIFEGTAGFAEKFYPEYKFNASFSGFSESIAKYELDKNPDYKNLNSQDKKKALGDGTGQVMKKFAESFGISPNPQTPLRSVLYEFLASLLREWQTKFGFSFVVAWGILVFFALEGIGMLFRLLVVSLSFLTYHLLLAMNLISITGESRTREAVDFT